MKRFHLLLISCLFVATSFAQGYSEQQLASIMDSVSTNPDYVIRWADGNAALSIKVLATPLKQKPISRWPCN